MSTHRRRLIHNEAMYSTMQLEFVVDSNVSLCLCLQDLQATSTLATILQRRSSTFAASAAAANVTGIVIPAAVESHVTESALLAAQASEPVHILSHLRL